ncbi:MAG: hypothetical protein JNK82_07840 [Myxococcaceae bacterium]|nr:hypothetical protein [Myxococcaceae bacterium]
MSAVVVVVVSSCGASPAACGVGTTRVGERCEPLPVPVTCGEDTALQGSTCITVLSCGQGASRSGNQCVATPVDVTCGVGTELQGNVCVSTGGGGAGTTCGTGTALLGSSCVVDLGTVCSTDTTGAGGNRCVGTVTCGAGTMKNGTECVAMAGGATCGPGTELNGTVCQPVQSTGPLTTFLATANLAASGHAPYTSTYSDNRRFVVTELTQGNADAWAATGANMVGNGRALHITGYGTWNVSTAATFVTVEDTAPTGTCGASANPNTSPSSSNGVRVGLYAWLNGAASRTACARSGTMKVERFTTVENGTRTRVTLNAYFSDGTTLTDKVLVF